MKLLRTRIPLLAICFTVLAVTSTKAQTYQCVDGVDYNTYNADTLRIVSFKGLPGDTIEMPLFFKADSIALALTANIRYDASMLTPITYPEQFVDTNINFTVIPPDTTIDTLIIDYLDIREVGRARFLDTLQDALGFDSIVVRDLFRANSVKVKDSSLLKIQWLPKIPAQGESLDSLPGGRGEIVRVKFVVNDGLAEGASSPVTIENLPVLDTSFFPYVQSGCALCASAQNWVVAFTNPNPPPDTIYQVLGLSQVPRLRPGTFLVDTPVVVECTNASECAPRAGVAAVFGGEGLVR